MFGINIFKKSEKSLFEKKIASNKKQFIMIRKRIIFFTNLEKEKQEIINYFEKKFINENKILISQQDFLKQLICIENKIKEEKNELKIIKRYLKICKSQLDNKVLKNIYSTNYRLVEVFSNIIFEKLNSTEKSEKTILEIKKMFEYDKIDFYDDIRKNEVKKLKEKLIELKNNILIDDNFTQQTQEDINEIANDVILNKTINILNKEINFKLTKNNINDLTIQTAAVLLNPIIKVVEATQREISGTFEDFIQVTIMMSLAGALLIFIKNKMKAEEIMKFFDE